MGNGSSWMHAHRRDVIAAIIVFVLLWLLLALYVPVRFRWWPWPYLGVALHETLGKDQCTDAGPRAIPYAVERIREGGPKINSYVTALRECCEREHLDAATLDALRQAVVDLDQITRQSDSTTQAAAKEALEAIRRRAPECGAE